MGTSVNPPAQLRCCHAKRSSPLDLENRHASLIQRDGHENNKSDTVPVEWGNTTALLAQNDIVARWTKQGGQQDESGWKIASANLDRWKGGVAGKDHNLN